MPSSPGLGAGPAICAESCRRSPTARPGTRRPSGGAARGACRGGRPSWRRSARARPRGGRHRRRPDPPARRRRAGGRGRPRIDAGRRAARAWHDAARDRRRALRARSDDPYLRARTADVLDVGRRVVERLTGSGGAGDGAAGVLAAQELGAAEVAALDPHGRRRSRWRRGADRHAAIIARALGIPAVTGLGDRHAGDRRGHPAAARRRHRNGDGRPSAASLSRHEARTIGTPPPRRPRGRPRTRARAHARRLARWRWRPTSALPATSSRR